MNDTIFYRLKEQLGINSEDTSFDYELLMHIKTAFATLTQLGVFDTTPKIDKEITWDAVYIEANPSLHELQDFLEGFVFLEVKLIFDPPTASTLSHLDKMSEELKWRIKEAYTPIIKNPVIDSTQLVDIIKWFEEKYDE